MDSGSFILFALFMISFANATSPFIFHLSKIEIKMLNFLGWTCVSILAFWAK